MVDSARTRATTLSEALPCINTNQVTGKINLSEIVIHRQFQDVDSAFTQDDLDFAVMLNNWLGFNPEALPGRINRLGCRGLTNCSAYFSVDFVSGLFLAENFGYGAPPLNYLWSWGDNTYDSVYLIQVIFTLLRTYIQFV